MDLDGASLIASLIVSSIGFVVFAYGKRLQRLPQVLVGLAMMAFPYFVDNVIAIAGIAAGLLVALWISIRLEQ